MKYKYGEIVSKQLSDEQIMLRKRIYFLLLCVDPKTKGNYQGIDVNAAFDNILYEINGLNELLSYPSLFLKIMSLLEAARIEYNKPDFAFGIYRKLILDAGTEVLNIKGGDD